MEAKQDRMQSKMRRRMQEGAKGWVAFPCCDTTHHFENWNDHITFSM